ncbi:DUF6415 family natural product biosynthesis protein [Streptomyces sp. NPDC058374]|uniref:DUF6415 family natural product biosynthesis protein n=1 Tax=Streptomyces sp. NPDC058374 TaxID=3346466 RepID=UPI00364A801C
MRVSLIPRRDGSWPVAGRGWRAPVADGPERDFVEAASETVSLVLGEDSPLPESAADAEDLVRRLRGHVAQLGARTAPGIPALLQAQRLASDGLPKGYMPSRVYLVKLAEATQALVAAVQAHGVAPVQPARRRRWWKPQINVLRAAVFSVALACLVWAASVPRT